MMDTIGVRPVSAILLERLLHLDEEQSLGYCCWIPLPESDNRNKYTLVVTDYFIHWVEAFLLYNQVVSIVATKLVDKIFVRFGVPDQLHSDHGQQFEAQMIT